jgi:hypothetical protein
MTDETKPTRNGKGQFVKGQSGNPGGKPVGAGTIGALRRKLAENAESVVGVLYQQALRGDTAAATLLLSRCFPVLRSVDEPVTFPMPDSAPSDQARAVLRAVAAGELTPQQAGAILAGMAAAARVIETDELERRLEALERAT